MATTRVGASRRRVRHFPCKALELSRSVFRSLIGPLSKRALDHLERGEYQSLLDLEISPSDYSDPIRFRDDYYAVSLLSKFPGFPLGIKTAEVALKKFADAELQCTTINETLAAKIGVGTTTTSLASYIHMARANISSCLGPFSWDAAEEFFSFSHGASTRLPRRKGSPVHKYSGKPEVTLNALNLAVCAISRIPLWADNLREQYGPDPRKWVAPVRGNRVTTVPKNAKTDRCIAIEPCMNMFLQKGIGGLIRRRLGKVGIDLNDQSVNQRLAQDALIKRYATIDLKAASDTISIEVVRQLLPDDWFFAIMATRSEEGVLPDGTLHEYQKVSSMGNGYTFELESLIFWALARAVIQISGLDDTLGVYGDDLVVHQDNAQHLIWVLNECGFSVNLEKTFLSGEFFESCGKHYFQGLDVTPVFIRKPICDDFRLIWFANSIRRLAFRFYGTVSDYFFRIPYLAAVNELPPPLRRRLLPDNVGDGALIGSWDEVLPRFSLRTGMYSAKILEPRTRKTRPNGFQGLLTHWQTLPNLPVVLYTGWGGASHQCSKIVPFGDRLRFEVTAGTADVTQTSVASDEFRFATIQVSRWDDVPCWDCHLGAL